MGRMVGRKKGKDIDGWFTAECSANEGRKLVDIEGTKKSGIK